MEGAFPMNKIKRISALTGAILLLLLYISTLVFALIDSPLTNDLLTASIGATILIPVLLYGFLLFCRLRNQNQEEN